jgi:hypothetical protein
MTRTATLMRSLTLPPAAFVRSLFSRREAPPSDPRHSDAPLLRCAEIAAVYHSQRVAGDFYEFLRVGPSGVLFGLFDLAGRKEDTREILIAAQNIFRNLAPELFAGKDFNEAVAMVKLCHEVNRTILQVASAIRSCPAFIGSTTKTSAPSAIRMPATRPPYCETIPESRSSMPAAFRSASFPTLRRVPPPAR